MAAIRRRVSAADQDSCFPGTRRRGLRDSLTLAIVAGGTHPIDQGRIRGRSDQGRLGLRQELTLGRASDLAPAYGLRGGCGI